MEPRRGIILMKPPTHPPTHPPRRTSFFATCRPLIKKLLLQNVTNYYQGVQNWFSKQEMELSKQEMELSKQEMELFLSLPCFWSKNFFYNIFSIFTKEFKIGFQNRKWNYPNRKWNYFSHFQASDEKTFFITYSPYLPRNSKWIFKTGNGIIQTGNGIISPISRPPIKKLLLQNISYFYQGVQIKFSKQEMEWSKQEMELFILYTSLWSKNFFYKMFLI